MEKIERIASSAKDRLELLTLKLIGVSHLADLEDYGEDTPLREKSLEDWIKADTTVDELITEDSIRAFRLGLDLAGLPADRSKRSLFAWLQGLGLTIIESDKMKSHLASILATEENRERLMGVLNRFLDIDISRIPPEKLLDTPDFFSFARAIGAAFNCEGAEELSLVYNKAKQKLLDQGTFTGILELNKLKDTKPLAQKLANIREKLLATPT